MITVRLTGSQRQMLVAAMLDSEAEFKKFSEQFAATEPQVSQQFERQAKQAAELADLLDAAE